MPAPSAVLPLPGTAWLLSVHPSLQYADLLDVLDVLCPSGPIQSQFPLTFEAMKQVRGLGHWGTLGKMLLDAPGQRSRACLQTHFLFCAALLCLAGPRLRGVSHTAAPGRPGASLAGCSPPERLRPWLRDAAEGEAAGAHPSLARPPGSRALSSQGFGTARVLRALWGSPLAQTWPFWGQREP